MSRAAEDSTRQAMANRLRTGPSEQALARAAQVIANHSPGCDACQEWARQQQTKEESTA